MSRNLWIASTGILFLVVLAVAVPLAGEPPDPTEDSAAEVVGYYVDEEDKVISSSVLFTLAGGVFVVFAAAITRMLRVPGDGGNPLPTIAIAGATIFAVGMAMSGALAYAAADLADEETIGPETITTINAIGWDFLFPFAVGILLFFLATGIEIVRGGALPKWLGWIAIVIGAVALSPIGFGAALAGAAWVLVTSVVIGLRPSPG